MLFGNADVDELTACCLAAVGVEPDCPGCACCQGAYARVVAHAVEHVCGKCVDVVFGLCR